VIYLRKAQIFKWQVLKLFDGVRRGDFSCFHRLQNFQNFL